MWGGGGQPYPLNPPLSFVQLNNTVLQAYGYPAVVIASTLGVTIQGNTVTRTSGAPHPAFDFVGLGTANTSVVGNFCDGVACKTSGL